MKKIISGILLLLCLSLFACGGSKPPEITDDTWQLATVHLTEPGGYEQFLYVSDAYVEFAKDSVEESERCKNVPRIDCILTARRGELTLENKTNGKTYTGAYDDEEEFTPEATYYTITMGRSRGHALSQILSDKDGNELRTLSISIANYELFFMKR